EGGSLEAAIRKHRPDHVRTNQSRYDPMNASKPRHRVRLAAVAIALASTLLSAVPVLATYPGNLNGRLAIGSNIDGNFDIYTVLPNGEGRLRLTTDPLF